MPDVGKIKNVSGDDLIVPWLNGRIVLAGQVVEVPVEDVAAYTCQPANWRAEDPAAKKAHKQASEAADAAEDAEVVADGDTADQKEN